LTGVSKWSFSYKQKNWLMGEALRKHIDK